MDLTLMAHTWAIIHSEGLWKLYNLYIVALCFALKKSRYIVESINFHIINQWRCGCLGVMVCYK